MSEVRSVRKERCRNIPFLYSTVQPQPLKSISIFHCCWQLITATQVRHLSTRELRGTTTRLSLCHAFVICRNRFYFPLFATLIQILRSAFQKRLSGQFRQDSAIRNINVSDQNGDWFPRCFQNRLLLLFWSETQVCVSFNEIGLIFLCASFWFTILSRTIYYFFIHSNKWESKKQLFYQKKLEKCFMFTWWFENKNYKTSSTCLSLG